MGKTALQLYSLRHLTPTDLPGALKKVADMGFEGVEFAGYFDHSARELSGILEDLGLTAVGSHVGIAELRSNLQGVLDYSLELGSGYVVCPGVPTDIFKSQRELDRLADEFSQMGRAAAAAGLVFGYHNHSYEFEKAGEKSGYEYLFDRVDPDLVKMELDTCWAENAGYRSVDLMARYPRHMELLHIKELPQTGDPHDREIIGEGLMDFPAICALGRRMNCPWYIIEHEYEQGDVEGDIAAGLVHLKSLLK